MSSPNDDKIINQFRSVLADAMRKVLMDEITFDSFRNILREEFESALSRQRTEILDSLEEGLGEEIDYGCSCDGYEIIYSHMKEEIKKLR